MDALDVQTFDLPTLIDTTNAADIQGMDGSVDDGSSVNDSSAMQGDSGVCPMGTAACPMLGCVDTQSTLNHCGACGNVCPAVMNGTARCALGACTPTCNAGFEAVGAQCLQAGLVPRQIAPTSLGNVTLRRPTFRWELPAGIDGAVLDLCRDRACTMVIESVRAVGTSARPTMPLPARSVVFWRLRGTSGMGTARTFSPTWLLHVPERDASNGIDSSSSPHLDLNGDGLDDVVIGAYGADPGGRLYAGTASIYHGAAGGLPAVPTRVLEGAFVEDFFGYSVASAGDVNGDGFGDLIIGAYGADPGGRIGAGAANIYHGSATGVRAAPNRVVEGAGAGDEFGWALAGVGDLNGDGYADVVVGAQSADPSGRTDAGVAHVFHGSATGIAMAPTRVLEGTGPGDHFGGSVAGAGDVDGDSHADLVVGSVLASPGGRARAGSASLFLGSAMGVAMPADTTLLGGSPEELFGISVASAGDVNADGYSDLVVGVANASPNGRLRAGAAAIYHGSMAGISSVPTRMLEGAADTDRFGGSVSGAGDVNGDGYDDLIVGAVQADPSGRLDVGSASVYLGSPMGVSVPARVLEGPIGRELFGWAVAGLGDVDGDGFNDIAVTSLNASRPMIGDAGAVRIFRGSMMGIAAMPTLVLEGIATGDFFGVSVASTIPRYRARDWFALFTSTVALSHRG